MAGDRDKADPPSVLVTGAAGYLGRLVVAALAARRGELEALVALDVAEVPADQRLPGVIYTKGDICGAGLLPLAERHAIDTVVHLASIVRAPKGAPADLAYRVDVEGTRNVLEMCRATGAERLIVTSSGAAYGYHADNPEWLDEADPLRGNEVFAYAHHKRLVEQLLAAWREAHPELAQLVLRPGTIVGEDTRSPVTALFEMPVMLGVRGSESPFVFIWDQDVVACVLSGVFEGSTGIYNLAGDGALTPREIARRLGKPYLPLPAWLLRGALRLLKGLGVTEHGPERVAFLRWRPVLSNRRLKEELGYRPISSAEAFERYRRGLVVGR